VGSILVSKKVERTVPLRAICQTPRESDFFQKKAGWISAQGERSEKKDYVTGGEDSETGKMEARVAGPLRTKGERSCETRQGGVAPARADARRESESTGGVTIGGEIEWMGKREKKRRPAFSAWIL